MKTEQIHTAYSLSECDFIFVKYPVHKHPFQSAYKGSLKIVNPEKESVFFTLFMNNKENTVSFYKLLQDDSFQQDNKSVPLSTAIYASSIEDTYGSDREVH